MAAKVSYERKGSVNFDFLFRIGIGFVNDPWSESSKTWWFKC